MSYCFVDGNKYGLVPVLNVDPKRFEVTKIIRLQCEEAWKRYAAKKELIRSKWGGNLKSVYGSKYLRCKPFRFQEEFRSLGLEDSVNEVFLWHGCKNSFAKNLITKKALFDGRKASPSK